MSIKRRVLLVVAGCLLFQAHIIIQPKLKAERKEGRESNQRDEAKPSNTKSIATNSTRLPWCKSPEQPQFAYLLTMDTLDAGWHTDARYDAYRAWFARRAAAKLFILTYVKDERASNGAHAFVEGGSFGENRNELLRVALLHERQQRCRFLYYVFVDDHIEMFQAQHGVCAERAFPPTPDASAAEVFERWLLAERPAQGTPWRDFGRGNHTLGHTWRQHRPGAVTRHPWRVDHGIVAVRADAARWLLPFPAYFDPLHWIWMQMVHNFIGVALYSPWRASLDCVMYGKWDHDSATRTHNAKTQWPNQDQALRYVHALLRPASPLHCFVAPLDVPGANLSATLFPPLPLNRADVDARADLRLEHAHWAFVERFWLTHGAHAAVDIKVDGSLWKSYEAARIANWAKSCE